MTIRLKRSCICLLLLSGGLANAQVFPDNEARRAILDLRADVKRITEDSKKNFDKVPALPVRKHLGPKLVVRLHNNVVGTGEK